MMVAVTRTRPPQVARGLVPGRKRLDEPDATLHCVLLAPAPDWVAMDLATGALVRGTPDFEAEVPALLAEPLAPVALTLAPLSDPWDPSRPEAVELAGAVEGSRPSRRSLRRLLAALARRDDEGGLLGSLGPSVSFVDLEARRPSVVVLAPTGGRVRLVGENPGVAHFLLGDHAHALPLAAGAAAWLKQGHVPTAAGRTAKRGRAAHARALRTAVVGPGIEPTVPVYLVAGFDRPAGGQVRKVVLGVLPEL